MGGTHSDIVSNWFGGEKFRDHFENGIYVCSSCGHELFSSKVKYAHSTPWPAFTEPIHSNSLVKVKESARTFKVRCGKCNNGLGHEFPQDGPKTGISRF